MKLQTHMTDTARPRRSTPRVGDLARRLALGLVSVGLAATAPLASGTVYTPIDDEVLLRQSPLVAVVQVEASSAGDEASTTVRLAVERRLKGQLADDALLVLPKGLDRDGVMRHWSGTPRLETGDQLLVFLEPIDEQRVRLVHHALGAFRLVPAPRPNGEPRLVAVRALDGLVPLGADEADLPGRDFERFAHWIEERDAHRSAPADYRLTSSTAEVWAWAKSAHEPATADHEAAAGHETAGDQTSGRDKFSQLFSSTEPYPRGCGEAGGNPLRVALSDGFAFAWRSYFLGHPSLDQGGITALHAALAAWTDDPFSTVRLRHAGLAVSTSGLARSDQTNTLAFEDPHDQIAGRYEDGGVLAVAVPWYECEHHVFRGRTYHRIVEADIVFQDGLGDLFTAVEDRERFAEQLVARELGRTLGFGVSSDSRALLAAAPHDDLRGALLGVDDLVALATTYGNGIPAPPRGQLEAPTAGLEPGAVRLQWLDQVDGESLIHVERRSLDTANDVFEPIGGAAADGTDFVDTRAHSGRSYEYRLVPVSAGGRGTPSPVVAVTVPVGIGLPAAPSNLRGAAVSPERIVLTWRDNACDESEQQLHVLQNGVWVEVPFRIPADLERVVLEGLEPSSHYAFRLVARNAYGDSAVSKVAEVATPALDAACLPDDETLCLQDRFAVTARLDDSTLGTRPASATPIDNASGSFWFFHADNLELTVEILDERATTGFFAVRYGVLTSLGFDVTVTDTLTGAVRVYDGSHGETCGGEDLDAFPDPVAGSTAAHGASATAKSATACFLGANELSLYKGRFLLNMEYRNAEGRRVKARALDATLNAGHFSFGDDGDDAPSRIDWAVKILDGRVLNDSYWVFHGPVGPAVETWLTVDDLSTGSRRVYHRPAAARCSQIDLEAFADG
ncbi:MAG: fibronectin type III domain-containing protein [Acidobacteriota bacterium]